MQGMQEVPFGFKFVQGGQAKGLRAKKAAITEQAVILAGEAIRFEDITDTMVRDKRLIVGVRPGADLGEKTRKELVDGHALMLEISKADAGEVKREIDRTTSAIAAEHHHQLLEAAGHGDLFQVITCPHCEATIDLSELDATPLLYCPFCSSVISKNREVVTEGDSYQVCSECGLYGRIRPYTIFHFYFLLIVYGFRYQQRYLCDTCAQKTAIRTLLLNLIFLLGVPTAVYNYFKARSESGSMFPGLAKANALARKGNYREADRIYDRLSMESGHHPGILMNQGLGHLQGGDAPGAVEFFHASLDAASNFRPTWQVLDSLSVRRGSGDETT